MFTNRIFGVVREKQVKPFEIGVELVVNVLRSIPVFTGEINDVNYNLAVVDELTIRLFVSLEIKRPYSIKKKEQGFLLIDRVAKRYRISRIRNSPQVTTNLKRS